MASIKSNYDDEKNNIADNLPLDIMRLGMENRGVFLEDNNGSALKGALYCSTGKIITKTIGDDTYLIPEVIAINGPDTINVNTIYGIQFITQTTNGYISKAKLVPISN